MKQLIVFNPISNEGHLDSWHAMFIDLLLQAGCSVIAVTNDPKGLEQKLAQKKCSMKGLTVLGIENKPLSLRSRLRQLWQRWNAYCDARRFQQSQKGELLPLWLLKVVQRIFELLHQIYSGKNSGPQAVIMSNPPSSATHLDPQLFCHRVNQLIEQYPDNIAGVLNMYVDAYSPDLTSWRNFSLKDNLPWMGLCITPRTEPVEAYYQLQNYKGTLFLDEAVRLQYQQRMPGRNFEFLPDITETALPEKASALAEQIKRRARGRKIVFLGGSIGKQKNLARWLELVALADADKWFFVQIGRINKNNLMTEDDEALSRVQAQFPENLLIWSEYLPDERSFNEIIFLSDVIYAVYRDFGRSSNMLSKAAYFEKTILVTEDTLMATRVQQYGIGLAVKQDDPRSMLKGLEALEHLPDLANNFEAYRQDVSPRAVQDRLVSFIQKCITAEANQK
ncbi:glycosyltransferase family 4 protein [Orrella sp. NBD-18]|uniref:Glycosyltransferase family 4 protein n=1 Tax=Sheuella amnicola TaxID=2707330 RepID=A0A6B2QZP2_9BURK|nr:glycosyltransferase family 4 protein [Sheuella amnicola]NDY83492.1 glycosyltransferase family 4 protein [Sheuella amnicola]